VISEKHLQRKGTVYLVGAGPGDPDLLTLRATNVLKRAGVVVYDRLANPKILAYAPVDAERIYVGKRPGQQSVSQHQINRILIAKAKEGKIVVRLKGGDPFIFGRGGEECEALAGEKIPFEIVPGISSALAAPAYAGIPLTHRNVARSFTVVTGHTKNNEDLFRNWEHIAHSDTLVVLMGMKNLKKIISKLIFFGKAGDTPVAIVEKATSRHQRTVTGTLDNITEKAAFLSSPATIVIGELAVLANSLAWHTEPVNFGQESITELRPAVVG
jgi:uroporphyrin-III C-methyltransferase